MTCTFCGSVLDGNETECPYCGHRVDNDQPIKVQNEFSNKFSGNNMNNEPEYEPQVQQQAYNQQSYNQQPQYDNGYYNEHPMRAPMNNYNGGSNNKGNIISIGCAIISIVMTMVCLFVCLGVNNKVKSLNQDMLSQFYVLQSDIQSTMEQVQSNITSEVQTATAVDPSGGVLSVTKSPTSVTTVAVGDSNKLLFHCDVEGNDTLTFSWQKKSDTGEWVDLVWDGTSYNEKYGLMVYDQPYTNANGKYSELTAKNITEAASGDYRCKVSDKNGHYAYSEVASIIF